jgi:hypothetical protein
MIHNPSVQASVTQHPSPHTTLCPKHTHFPLHTPWPHQVHITITTTASPPTLFFHHPNHKHQCNILCFATKLLFLACLSLKTKAQWSLEISQTEHPMTQQHIPENLNLHFLVCLIHHDHLQYPNSYMSAKHDCHMIVWFQQIPPLHAGTWKVLQEGSGASMEYHTDHMPDVKNHHEQRGIYQIIPHETKA